MKNYLSKLNLSAKEQSSIAAALNPLLNSKDIDKDIFWNKFTDFILIERDLTRIDRKDIYLIKVAKNFIEERSEEFKPDYLEYAFEVIYRNELKPLGFDFNLNEIITIGLIESKMLTKLGLSQVSSITELNSKIGKYLKERKNITFKSFLRCLLKSQLLKLTEIEIDILEIGRKAKQEEKEYNEIFKELKEIKFL